MTTNHYQVQKREVTNSSRISHLEYTGYIGEYEGILTVTFKKGGRYMYTLPVNVIKKVFSAKEHVGKVFQEEVLNKGFKGKKDESISM